MIKPSPPALLHRSSIGNSFLFRASILLLLAFLFFFSLAMFSGAAQIEFIFEEKGKVISYYDNYFVTNINGTGRVTNPFNVTLYDVMLPFTLYPMTIVETSNTSYLTVDKIRITALPPKSNVSFSYKIVGIPVVDPMYSGRGVLESAIIRYLKRHYGSEDGRIYSSIMGTLQKANLENASVTGRNARVVSVVLENPTPLHYAIELIRVIKTRGMNPNQNASTDWLNTWEFPNDKFPKTQLKPRELYHIDILDKNASEGEVYWLSSKVYIPNVIITGNNTIKRFTEEDVLLIEGEESEVLENGTNISLLEQPLFIQKSVSKTVVQPGDKVDVEIVLTNLGFKTKYGWLYDYLPSGFEFISSPENSTPSNATWHVKIPPKKPLVMRYSLLYSDNISLGMDYFPSAKLVLRDDTLYSQSVPFVRQYIPEKMVYVQKTLRYSINDEVVVKIDVMNMGQSPVTDIVLKEYLSSSDVFREISQQPYSKGVWKIDEIPPASTWTVSYVTNERSGIALLPEVFGVSSSLVMKTLVMENVVRSDLKFSSTRIVEVLGTIILLLLPVLYLAISRRIETRKVRTASELSRKIERLKRETEPDTETRIKLMLKETKAPHGLRKSRHHTSGTHSFRKRPEDELKDIESRIHRMREESNSGK